MENIIINLNFKSYPTTEYFFMLTLKTEKNIIPQTFPIMLYIYKTEKTFKNEHRSKDAAAKKRPNTSGVGKINNYYEDIYIPPNNNTD